MNTEYAMLSVVQLLNLKKRVWILITSFCDTMLSVYIIDCNVICSNII